MRLVAESRSAAIFPRTFSHPPGEPWVKAFSDPLAKPLIRGVRQQRNRLAGVTCPWTGPGGGGRIVHATCSLVPGVSETRGHFLFTRVK